MSRDSFQVLGCNMISIKIMQMTYREILNHVGVVYYFHPFIM